MPAHNFTTGKMTTILSATSTAVTVGQTTQVIATVVNTQGQPMADISVGFSADSLATGSQQSAVTNAQGQTTAIVTDQAAQTVTVTATASGVSGSADVQFVAAGS